MTGITPSSRSIVCRLALAVWLVSSLPRIAGYNTDLFARTQTDGATQERAAHGVLKRLLPSHLGSFQFRVVSGSDCGGGSCFRIENHPLRTNGGSGPEIRIAGTSGVELSAGLYWYLKHMCGAHVSWKKTGGSQLETIPKPGSLPSVQVEGIAVRRLSPWSYYQNVVTSSYSFVWWDWERWEREIDWMALQGINLPLAFTGQETIWQNVYKNADFNLSKAELDVFFGGPAFLAWARMGNLHGWGGPLPQTWLNQQLLLQQRILTRMRDLGMTPVLPAFSGIVPNALRAKFPSAKIARLGDWNTVDGDTRWCCTYLLDPSDPLFVKIGKAFMEQQIKDYNGTQHVYNCDTFNENLPPSDDPAYISALGAAVYEAMRAGDRESVWLMQGWLFSSDDWFWRPPQMKALLHSVPKGRLVVLDLFAEVKPVWQRSRHFYGVPYIWCMLHNFGGNIEMYGTLRAVGLGPIEAFTSLNSTMVGVGMCMEGIEQNPVVYELMGEMSFQSEVVETEDWVVDYSARRYGQPTDGAGSAWRILHRSIYDCADGIADHNGDVIVEFPDIDPAQDPYATQAAAQKRNSLASGIGRGREEGLLGHTPHLWYSQLDAMRALGFLLSSSSEIGSQETYRYDLVDLTRQVLSKLANEMHSRLLDAFRRQNLDEVKILGDQFLGVLEDSEKVLASCSGFLLGPWLESSKALATNDEEKALYEWNARTQVTMWFDNTEDQPSPLHDYANKMWSGLIEGYYLPRAALYVNMLKSSLLDNSSFPFETWRKQWIRLTNDWQASQNTYPVEAHGDSVQIVSDLYQKYKDLPSHYLKSPVPEIVNCHLDCTSHFD